MKWKYKNGEIEICWQDVALIIFIVYMVITGNLATLIELIGSIM